MTSNQPTTAHAAPMPVVFVGHGSPMNAIADNVFHWQWSLLGQRLPRPRAVLCVSAHWQAQGTRLTGASHPTTLHDFFGFPQALFDVEYPAPGDAKLARRVVDLLGGHKLAHIDATRGLDHGAWSVLRAMYPAADVPVVQLSIDTTLPGEHHYELAKKLAPLREEGVLVLGSGNIVHNLALFDGRDARPQDWAIRFDGAVKRRIGAREHIELVDWPRMGPDAQWAIPTPEHYLPLLYVLALQRDGDHARFFNEQIIGSLSMTSVAIESSGAAAANSAPIAA